MKKLIIIAFLLPLFSFSQEELKGIILEKSAEKENPLPGANVYWLGSSVGTITNEDGTFSLPYKFSYNRLVISYVGFKTDTLIVKETKYIRHVLQATKE